MRLYAVALITWAITITTSSEPNNENLSDEKFIGYTEFRDSPAKQIVQPYVTGIEARNSGQISANDYSDDAANAGLSRSTEHSDTKGTNDVSTTDSSLTESIYTISFTRTTENYPFREYPSHELRYTIPENVLLVENAGSFGQRVQQGHTSEKNTIKTTDGRQDNEHANSQKSFSSTVSPLENDNNHRKSSYASSTREPFMFAIKQENNLTDDSPFDDHSEVIGSKTSTRNSDGIFNIRSTTENLLAINSNRATNSNIASILENDVVPESLPMPQARSSRAHNITANEITKKNTESVKESESIAKTSTSVEISPSLQLGKFSGPIVVPELPNRETQDVAIDYLDDNEASGVLKSVGNTGIILESNVEASKAAASNSKTMSSIMLNPLQVGIALMNIYETGLVDDSEQSAATDTKDYLRDDLQRLVDKEFIKNNENQSRVNYKDENFQSDEEEKPVGTVIQKDSGNSVEIQKSVELYHTAPIHEIHYPVEYIQQTSNLGIIETNNIGSSQRKSYGQDEPSESRQNYDIYRGNDQDEKNVIKVHASALSQNHNQDEYNALEDDTGRPVVSTLIAEYSSSTHEQTPFNRYNDVQPVFLVPNQFDDTLYDQSNVQHSLNSNDNGMLPHTKSTGSFTRQEIANEHIKPYVSGTYREQQPQSNQPIDYQHPFRSEATRRPETPQFLLKIIPNGSSVDGGFLVPIPRPYPIEKVVEKTVHVPHPIEIEKVIEKKVPYPVERVVEKQVQIPMQVPVPLPQPVPQLYPVQVPIDRVVEKQIHVPHLYPIHIERVVEKRVPYTIQRLLVQPPPPYPLHARVPTAYSAHVPPTHVTAPIEKAAERLAASSRPPRPYDNSGTIETKFNKHQQKSREPVSPEENANLRGGGDTGGSGADGFALKPHQNEENVLQFYSSSTDPYSRPLAYDYNNINVGKSYIPAAHYSNVRFMILPKKFGGHVMLRPHANAGTPVSFRRHIILHNLVDKDKVIKNEYVGPAPLRKTPQMFPQSKSPQSTTSAIQSSAASATLRRSRQPETQYPGSFRQSKMEYGFKPPMVPSVQYDENTASKVEN